MRTKPDGSHQFKIPLQFTILPTAICRFVQMEYDKGVSSKWLLALGWKFRAVEETLRDTIDSYKAAGILN